MSDELEIVLKDIKEKFDTIIEAFNFIKEKLVVCVINPFTMFVIPAEAGIQKNIYWMPHQVRHDMPTKIKEVLDALH
ncbi:MAG: hypothetical protein Q7U55_11650 [Deltaproteobacteria bacterium]|nr:hypothetical protein [Deltaproteobacteria bacterium]